MKWILVAYFISTGMYTEQFSSQENCEDAVIEAAHVRGPYDIQTAECYGPDDEIETVLDVGISP